MNRCLLLVLPLHCAALAAPTTTRLRAGPGDDGAADLIAAAAALREEAAALEAEIGAAAPPRPAASAAVSGVAASERFAWDGSAFASAVELAQGDGSAVRTPVEFAPWFGPGASVVFRRAVGPPPLGLVLEEGGGGSVVVGEVAAGGAAATADVRVGDVLRACSTSAPALEVGNAVFPLDGATPRRRRVLAPCDKVASFDAVLDAVRANPGGAVLVLERALEAPY